MLIFSIYIFTFVCVSFAIQSLMALADSPSWIVAKQTIFFLGASAVVFFSGKQYFSGSPSYFWLACLSFLGGSLLAFVYTKNVRSMQISYSLEQSKDQTRKAS